MKKRGWELVTYPDSMPSDWETIIDATQLEWWMSPLHDRDTDENGVLKKPHFHHTVYSQSNIEGSYIVEICTALGSKLVPQPVKRKSASIQYHFHLNSPTKYLYPIEGFRVFGGADYAPYLAVTLSEKQGLLCDVINYCEDLGIVEFADLVNECVEGRLEKRYLDCVCSNVMFLRSYLQSRKFMSRDEELKNSDKITYVKSRRKVGRL